MGVAGCGEGGVVVCPELGIGDVTITLYQNSDGYVLERGIFATWIDFYLGWLGGKMMSSTDADKAADRWTQLLFGYVARELQLNT